MAKKVTKKKLVRKEYTTSNIRHQAIEIAFESQNAGVEIVQDDEAIGGIVKAEGAGVRYCLGHQR